MSAKKLKELPGFDDALVAALAQQEHEREQGYETPSLEEIGEVVLPGMPRVRGGWVLYDIARHIWSAVEHEKWLAKQRLRLVPPAKPEAANDG